MSGNEALILPNELSILDVEQWHHQLQAILAGTEQPPVLSAADVERVDTAFLQLLASFCIACRQQHRPAVWQACSDSFCISAALLGLNDVLGLQQTSTEITD